MNQAAHALGRGAMDAPSRMVHRLFVLLLAGQILPENVVVERGRAISIVPSPSIRATRVSGIGFRENLPEICSR